MKKFTNQKSMLKLLSANNFFKNIYKFIFNGTKTIFKNAFKILYNRKKRETELYIAHKKWIVLIVI